MYVVARKSLKSVLSSSCKKALSKSVVDVSVVVVVVVVVVAWTWASTSTSVGSVRGSVGTASDGEGSQKASSNSDRDLG